VTVVPEEDTPQDQQDVTRRTEDLAAALRFGHEVERDDPNIGFESPPSDEIE
jgi:hypothetical protein